MKIALVTDGISPYVVGGMQKHSYYLARFLAENGCTIDLYHYKVYNREKTAQEIFGKASENIRLIEVPFPSPGKLPLHYLRESKTYSKLLYNEFLSSGGADFIICKGFTAWEFIEKKKAGVQLPPVAVNFHGYEMFQRAFTTREKIIQRFLRRPVREISRNADFVFSYGGKITTILREQLKIEENKILEFPSGIEEGWLNRNVKPSGAKKRFLFIGRFEARKGIAELTSVVRDMNEGGWSFDFIGDIPEHLRIRKSSVTYHGLITNPDDIRSIMRECDVLVCPSWSEGMPNVILEGMASGLAAIATDTGATRLLVNDETGWLLASPERENLKYVFEVVLNTSPEELNNKRKKAVNLIESSFLWKNIAGKITSRLKEIIDERGIGKR